MKTAQRKKTAKSTFYARLQTRGGVRGSGISQRIAVIASTLGMVERMLFDWVKAQRQGKLKKVENKRVSTK